MEKSFWGHNMHFSTGQEYFFSIFFMLDLIWFQVCPLLSRILFLSNMCHSSGFLSDIQPKPSFLSPYLRIVLRIPSHRGLHSNCWDLVIVEFSFLLLSFSLSLNLFFFPLATFSFSHKGTDVELLITKSMNLIGKQSLLFLKAI